MIKILALSLSLAASLAAEPFALNQAEEKRVEDLLRSLSLKEKIGQLNQYGWFQEEWAVAAGKGEAGSFLNVVGAKKTNEVQEKSKKIPQLFGLDVIHGYASIFPLPLAEACSWDLGLAERTAEAAAIEAKAAGVRWTFAPMVDIARDPRWGRVMEAAGEDPLLGAAFAAARVRGFQRERRLLACVKHFVAYGGAEAGRDYNAVDMPERKMWEVYYPPFQAGIEAGAATMMSSFNTLNGVPLAADEEGLRSLVKGRFGFKGMVVSDWDSVGELSAHGVAADQKDAARQGLLSGVDMDMAGFNYLKHMEALVAEGKVPEALVTDAARRVLQVKAWLGLLDKPLTDASQEEKLTLSPAHRSLALEAARKSCVLLKNEGVLPLAKGLKKAALIGPLGDSPDDFLGNWSAQGKKEHVVSLRQGLKAVPGLNVAYAKGCDVTGTSKAGFAAALAAAAASDVVLMALGEHRNMSGEAYCRTDLGLPGVQRELLEKVLALKKPTVLIVFNGRPLALQWEQDHVPAILEAWLPGIEGGNAITDILFGNFNPEGRLAITFPRSVGQLPIYYSALPTARPSTDKKWTSKYLDSPNSPLYTFGYGLSYTRFEYSGLSVAPSLAQGKNLDVSVKVKNAGKVEGVDTVQLYLRDPLAQVSRPLRELRAFEKVALAPGEEKTVRFSLPPSSLGYFDRKMKFGVEAGRFEVFVGANADAPLKAEFTLEGEGFRELAGLRPALPQEQVSKAPAFVVEGPGKAVTSDEAGPTGPTGPAK